MSYQPLLQVDNDRCHQLEDSNLSIGDARITIEESDLQSPKARTARRNALAMLHNAQRYLDEMYDAEIADSQRRAKKAGL